MPDDETSIPQTQVPSDASPGTAVRAAGDPPAGEQVLEARNGDQDPEHRYKKQEHSKHNNESKKSKICFY